MNIFDTFLKDRRSFDSSDYHGMTNQRVTFLRTILLCFISTLYVTNIFWLWDILCMNSISLVSLIYKRILHDIKYRRWSIFVKNNKFVFSITSVCNTRESKASTDFNIKSLLISEGVKLWENNYEVAYDLEFCALSCKHKNV